MLLIVPTRGRPSAMSALDLALCETVTTGINCIYAIDDDDPHLDEYLEVTLQVGRTEVGPRLRVGPTLDRIAVSEADHYDAIAFMGDDHRPRVPGWDKHFLDQIAEIPGTIVYGNDLFQGPNLPTAVAMDSRIPRTLGRITPPGCLHLFLDNAWKAWGERLGTLAYLPDVIIEHLHPQAGKNQWDKGYIEVNSGASWRRDLKAWNRYYQDGQLEADVLKLQRALLG